VRDLEEDLKVQWRAICAEESGDHSPEQVEVKTDSDAEEIPWTDEEVTRLCMELEEYVQTGDYDKMQEVMSALIVEDYEDRTTANGPMVYYTAKMNQKKQLQLLKKAEEMKLTGAYKFAVAMSGIQIEGLPVSEKGQGSYQIIFGDWAKKEHLIHVAVSTDQTAAWCETEVGDLSPDEEYTEWDRYIDLGLTGYVKYGYHEIVDYTPDGAMLFFGRTNTIVYVGSSMQAFVTGDMKQLDDYIIRNNRSLSHGFVDGFWDFTLGGVENTIHSLGNNIKEPALYLVKTVKGNNGESTGQKAWKIPLAVLQLGAGVPLFTSGERAEKDIAAIKKVLSGDVKIPNREELKGSIKAVGAGIYADFQRDPNALINNFIEKCYYGAGYIDGSVIGMIVDQLVAKAVKGELAGSSGEAIEGFSGEKMAETDGSLPVTEKPSVVQHIADDRIPTSVGEAGIETSYGKSSGVSGADNIADAARLKEYYKQAEKYGTGSIKELENGRFRFYEEIKPARTNGEMVGARHVREWDPYSGLKRDWYETIDHNGNIRQVRPDPNITGGVKVHYMFDSEGKYIGKWSPK